MNNIKKEKNKKFSNEKAIPGIINPNLFSEVERYSQKKTLFAK